VPRLLRHHADMYNPKRGIWARLFFLFAHIFRQAMQDRLKMARADLWALSNSRAPDRGFARVGAVSEPADPRRRNTVVRKVGLPNRGSRPRTEGRSTVYAGTMSTPPKSWWRLVVALGLDYQQTPAMRYQRAAALNTNESHSELGWPALGETIAVGRLASDRVSLRST
jgi:hypothetical protein